MKVPRHHLFCYWEWILAVFYILGLYPFPHLIPLLGSAIYTTITAITFSNRYDVIIAIIFWECFVLHTVYKKWSTDHKISEYRLLPDVILFGVYLLYIYSQGESFYSIYFEKVPQVHTKFRGSILEYITR